MKRALRCLICVLMCVFLGGCGIRQRAYVVVEPHEEDYQKSADESMTVGSYGGLKNAVLSLVEDGEKDGVIRAEGYTGDLDEDLSQAVHEVAELSPLGVFAVEHMTYDYSRIVSYYEIHLNITFRRSSEEITSIAYVTDMDAVREKLQEAMAAYESQLLLRVGNYKYLDIADAAAEIYQTHPEFALELPEASMKLYPDSGTQRILEIKFSYRHDREELLEWQAELQQRMSDITRIYASAQSDMVNAKRLYKRLGRDALLLEGVESDFSIADSAYGVLLEGQATSYGFAQTYLGLLDACGIKGELISGQRNGARHYWCLIELDREPYYVDPSFSTQDQTAEFFLMGSEELQMFGYQSYQAEALPEVVLPDYMKPEPPAEE